MKGALDSRTIKPGEYFVAVKGRRFDGRDFAKDALKKGAAGILEIDELYHLARKKLAEVGPKVIAVTGSYGKTMTKEMIHRVLSSRFVVYRTRGNLNTPFGVAMEVVNYLKPRHQILVAEAGMDRLGEIAKTCGIIKPQIGVITAVGEMHLEKLRTLENIRKAKAELLQSLPSNGVGVLNREDFGVRKIARVFGGRKIWFSFHDVQGLKLELLGKANLSNAAAASAVGGLLGVSK